MTLLKQYLLLCFFKNEPTDLEPSRSFILRCVAFYLVSGIIIEGLISDPVSATIEVSLRTVIAFSLLAILAAIKKKWFVFVQLLTAIFICENFIITLGISTEILDGVMESTNYAAFPFFLGILLLVWYLAIVAYIFRRVFSFTKLHSAGLSFVYFCSTYGVPFLVMELL
jgi:hypothetical protein